MIVFMHPMSHLKYVSAFGNPFLGLMITRHSDYKWIFAAILSIYIDLYSYKYLEKCYDMMVLDVGQRLNILASR
jgi:hypothetical protein